MIGALTGVALAMGRPGLPGTSMQAAAWGHLHGRGRHNSTQPPDYPAPSVDGALVCCHVYLRLKPRAQPLAPHWSHLGDSFAAVGVIAFTLASLLIVDLGLNWRELTTRRADNHRL